MDALARDVGGNDSLRTIGRVRRYWWLVLLGALLGMLAGSMATTVVDKQYSSTTLVSVSGIPDATTLIGGRTNSSVNMDNELQVLESAAVISGAKKLLGVDTDPTVLAAQVSATVPANTSFMAITFLAGTPEKARAGSEAFAQAYLTQRKADVDALIAVQREGLVKELADDTALLNKYAAGAAVLPVTNPTQKADEAYVQIYQGRIGDTKQQIANLDALDVSPVSIVTPPVTPTGPAVSRQVRLVVFVLTGLFAGLLTAAALAAIAPTRPKKTPPSLSPA
jgi:uncharacterized protein involved in exopolysaccharide biosynthesis